MKININNIPNEDVDKPHKELLERYKAFLDYMNVDYEADVLLKTSGGNSVVCNNETEWQECLGRSINEVVEIVAKATGKKTKWEIDEY